MEHVQYMYVCSINNLSYTKNRLLLGVQQHIRLFFQLSFLVKQNTLDIVYVGMYNNYYNTMLHIINGRCLMMYLECLIYSQIAWYRHASFQ